MSKYKFFSVYLVVTFFVGLIFLVFLVFTWYPLPLIKATGVASILGISILIELILGPLLALLVYKVGKKTLRFDIFFIVLLQILALFYIIYIVEQGRPVWVVFNVDRFELIRKNELIGNRIEEAKIQFQQPSWLKPNFAAIEFSDDLIQQNNDMFEEVLGGISISQKPERYVDLSNAKSNLQQRALSLEALEKYNSKDSIAKIVKKYQQVNAWVPLKASAVDMVVLINKESAEVIKIVDLRPWN